MKNISKLAVAILFSSAIAMTSCGLGTQGATGMQQPATTPSTSTTAGANALGALLGGATGSSSSLLTGVIGSLMNGISQGSIIGTWVYAEPSVEFESQNLLAQAGGMVAANQVIQKINPYYEKIGLTPGKFSITFKEDKTCTVTINGKTQTANYTYDTKTHQLKITGQNLGLSFGTAYATVTATQLSMTFDSSKLLSLAQGIASASNNSTLTTLSSLSSSFNGMKTGFKFNKK